MDKMKAQMRGKHNTKEKGNTDKWRGTYGRTNRNKVSHEVSLWQKS
jgi:hypothetical protein